VDSGPAGVRIGSEVLVNMRTTVLTASGSCRGSIPMIVGLEVMLRRLRRKVDEEGLLR